MKGEGFMENTLFKEYEKWCVDNKKDPLKEESVAEFKEYKQQQELKKVADTENEKKAELIAKQEAIFKMICEYVGVKAKYDEEFMFEALDDLFRALTLATVVCNKEKEVSKVVDKVLG